MQASLPIPALWSETEAVPMPLPVPPKTDVAEQRSDDWLRCSSLLGQTEGLQIKAARAAPIPRA